MRELSINRGPLVAGKDVDFEISKAHAREITDFLWSWVMSLPEELSRLVTIIAINPSRSFHNQEQIEIRVVICDGYAHYLPDGSGKMDHKKWESNFTEIEFYYMRAERLSLDKGNLRDRLNYGLAHALLAEKKTLQLLAERMKKLFDLLVSEKRLTLK